MHSRQLLIASRNVLLITMNNYNSFHSYHCHVSYHHNLVIEEANLFLQFSLATESCNESSTLSNARRAHCNMKFLWHSEGALEFPPTNVSSWLCSSLLLMQSILCWRYHQGVLWPTQHWDKMCGHRCFPSKPDNLNTTWNQ